MILSCCGKATYIEVTDSGNRLEQDFLSRGQSPLRELVPGFEVNNKGTPGRSVLN
jgi:hypothetical protein